LKRQEPRARRRSCPRGPGQPRKVPAS
jgi:hypothetical protein